MAYKKVGSVLKSKTEGENDYIKFDTDVSFKKGDTLKLENKKSKLASLEKNVENGKLSGDLADKIRDQIENTPVFIRFDLVQITKN